MVLHRGDSLDARKYAGRVVGGEVYGSSATRTHDEATSFSAASPSIFGITLFFSSNSSSSPDWCTVDINILEIPYYTRNCNEMIHTAQYDVASTDELAANVELWDGRPVTTEPD